MLGVSSFVKDNHSRSRKNTIRGLHFQVGEGQAKLVRVPRGAILDVVVDLRWGSASYGSWQGFRLDDVAHHMLFIPVGFAHGFCTLTDVADVNYKVSGLRDPSEERTLIWNDNRVQIRWPVVDPVLSARDAAAPSLAELEPTLVHWAEARAALG
jgi:dTDP-4-dehydrorhamnose 3,5-epimerase